MAELDDRVLLGTRGVVGGDVADLPVPSNQVHTVIVKRYNGERLLILEYVQPPALGGALRLLRLVILENDSALLVSVGFLCQ